MKFSAVSLFSIALSVASGGRIPPPSMKYHGDMRYFTPGLGSCGYTNTTGQAVVSLSAIVMNNGPNPNTNPKCGSIVTIKYKGIVARGEVVDTCPTCAADDVNVSSKMFQKFAPLSQGVVDGVTWHFNSPKTS